jgi:tetrapyrrole methylase family protein/MazG family protein
MVDFENKNKYGVYDLKKLIAVLRAPGGCPWDAEQTHESIKRNFLEETYEVIEAIDEKNPDHLCEELGDVLTQVVFHAGMEEEEGRFDLDDVADMVCRKLILRHPHVFGNTVVSGSGDVLKNWEDIKRVEKHQDTVTDSLKAVAKSLPGLWRAEKIQKKAAKAGFDWPDVSGAMDKLAEELTELSDAVNSGVGAEEELGDLLFSVVNVARHLGLDPEVALGKSCDKFISRFEYVELESGKEGKILSEMTLSQMDELYERGKKQEGK